MNKRNGEHSSPSAAIRHAYDPVAFRTLGHGLIDQLSDYLTAASQGTLPVLPWIDPATMAARWDTAFAPSPVSSAEDLFRRILQDAHHLHHPRYVGHQVTAPLPLAALCDLLSALLNNGMAVYEMGPVATAMERTVACWMTHCLGWSEDAGGFFTSGGSLGNLTALLGARQNAVVKAPDDPRPLALVTSEMTHYCSARAAHVMGLGPNGVLRAACDTQFRMRPEGVERALRDAAERGQRVFAVVASACSTATGTFDPLGAIADVCAAHDVWLHVDGAHGASAALSPSYRSLLNGIERADSVVWDAHKMMLMPALVTAVLFRCRQDAYATFAQEASYLFGSDDDDEVWYDVGLRTVECTKTAMIGKLYISLMVLGTTFFGDYVTTMFDLGKRFARQLQDADDFALATEPDGNIVCFRYLPSRVLDADALQRRIRITLRDEGSFYLVQTQLPAGLFLRITLINPLTTNDHLTALIERIRKIT